MNTDDLYLIKNNPIDDEWLGVDTYGDVYKNPIIDLVRDKFFRENPHLLPIHLFKQPDFLAYAVWVLFEVKLLPFQAVVLAELWERPFPVFVGTRGFGKTFLMAVYAMLRALFYPNYKVVIVGAAFRQSKLVFEYCEKLWQNGPVYRSLCDSKSGTKTAIDKLIFYINSSTIIAIPIGHGGEKIRGLRANCIIADEFDSHNVDTFERVIVGFGAVSADPADNVINQARQDKLKDLDVDFESTFKQKSNQIIISGTCGYFFGPLYHYFRRNEAIVNSKGDPAKIAAIFNGAPPDAFDWRDYSTIRIPYDILPRGFMDEKTIARAKATMNSTIFDMEYMAVFAEDSDGFFKRSIVEGCVASDKNIASPNWVSWCPHTFEPFIQGNPNGRYVFGIDPASEHDNLAIAILELHNNHARLAHMWTTNREDFKQRQKKGFTQEEGYNAFVARKIRNLMKTFPCVRIGIDAQGGGHALMEALQDKNTLEAGESLLWEVVDYDKPKESDAYSGLHILEAVEFAKYDWLYSANYGLAKDMETRKLIFPRFDPVSIDLAIMDDKNRITSFEKSNHGKTIIMFDTLEDLFMEIEDLKDELSSIVVSVAGTGVNGRLRWNVPEVQLEGNKKGRGRKDRYSALLIANSIARRMYKDVPDEDYKYGAMGGLVSELGGGGGGGRNKQQMYTGPDWYTSAMNKIYQ